MTSIIERFETAFMNLDVPAALLIARNAQVEIKKLLDSIPRIFESDLTIQDQPEHPTIEGTTASSVYTDSTMGMDDSASEKRDQQASGSMKKRSRPKKKKRQALEEVEETTPAETYEDKLLALILRLIEEGKDQKTRDYRGWGLQLDVEKGALPSPTPVFSKLNGPAQPILDAHEENLPTHLEHQMINATAARKYANPELWGPQPEPDIEMAIPWDGITKEDYCSWMDREFAASFAKDSSGKELNKRMQKKLEDPVHSNVVRLEILAMKAARTQEVETESQALAAAQLVKDKVPVEESEDEWGDDDQFMEWIIEWCTDSSLSQGRSVEVVRRDFGEVLSNPVTRGPLIARFREIKAMYYETQVGAGRKDGGKKPKPQ